MKKENIALKQELEKKIQIEKQLIILLKKYIKTKQKKDSN
jgi:hypothetical protein